MPTAVVEAIASVIALISVGSFVLIGMRMRLNAKVRLQKPPEAEKLQEAVETLYDQTQLLREGLSELNERMDFHERLLTRQSRAKVDTPV